MAAKGKPKAAAQPPSTVYNDALAPLAAELDKKYFWWMIKRTGKEDNKRWEAVVGAKVDGVTKFFTTKDPVLDVALTQSQIEADAAISAAAKKESKKKA